MKILTAAREIIAEQGRDRFTTGDITVRAGVSIGTCYRHFPDRAALLEVLLTSSPCLEQAEQDALTAAVRLGPVNDPEVRPMQRPPRRPPPPQPGDAGGETHHRRLASPLTTGRRTAHSESETTDVSPTSKESP
ncbi:helix-turn-helix domain-containing protein [Rathayibacter iranicus]